ncbi:MAG: glycosyltransferase [Candidatus Obscuribacterales bacterium]|nr:glycosyltransferase [Candidatus Obscuribacterales bacterium]
MLNADALDLMVVMPVYNEAESIGAVLVEWIRELGSDEIRFKILVLDDGYNDGTGAAVSSDAHPMR